MKAAVCLKYGSPEHLKVMEVPLPSYREDEVLIRVMASSVNTGDVRVRGLLMNPLQRQILRLILGYKKPRNPILGAVLAGEIVAIGAAVTTLSVGDQVYAMTGMRFGGHAQYAVLSEKSTIAKKPKSALYEEAAVLPFGGNTALHFLKKAGIKKGDHVLIYGAAGSVGTSAIQIANYFGARVTAVSSEKHWPILEKLGAYKYLDYKKEDFETHAERYDIIFDAVDKTSKRALGHLLKQGGRFTSVSGYGVAKERKEDLMLLAAMFDEGKLSATIDRTFQLEDIAAAHLYVEQRTKTGNVALTIGHN